jgi:glutamate-5-semialdehyde dehydrogenase
MTKLVVPAAAGATKSEPRGAGPHGPAAAPSVAELMGELGRQARAALRELAVASAEAKTTALIAASREVRAQAAMLLEANARDLASAAEGRPTAAFLDRLTLDMKRIEAMARGLEEVSALPDPVGSVMARWTRPNGLKIERVRVPLGVVGVVYREAVGLMLRGLDGAIDVIVPRGGKSLVARVQEEARVPVFAHLEGLCHTYVDRSANLDMAKAITVNAKMRRTGVCGATETLLVDAAAPAGYLPALIAALVDAGCEVRGDAAARAADTRVRPASEQDWSTEYLDAIISVKTVAGVDGAIAHIQDYGSQHTDCIVTEDKAAAERFLTRLDSAILLHNASTQFADGGEFGMGAEIGIATGRMHARGPVGVEQLTTFKYVVRGSGQVRPG